MTQAAEDRTRSEGTVEGGRVIAGDGVSFAVVSADQRLVARRAVGCLVEPIPGDRVLVATVDAEAFILSVLERGAAVPCRITSAADLEISSRGTVRVEGAEGIDLTTRGEATVTAETLSIRALVGNLVFQKARALADAVDVDVARVTVLAKSIDQFVDRFHQRAKRVFRVVEQAEHVEAGTLEIAASKAVSIRAPNAFLTAEQLVKLDGGQVHIG